MKDVLELLEYSMVCLRRCTRKSIVPVIGLYAVAMLFLFLSSLTTLHSKAGDHDTAHSCSLCIASETFAHGKTSDPIRTDVLTIATIEAVAQFLEEFSKPQQNLPTNRSRDPPITL